MFVSFVFAATDLDARVWLMCIFFVDWLFFKCQLSSTSRHNNSFVLFCSACLHMYFGKFFTQRHVCLNCTCDLSVCFFIFKSFRPFGSSLFCCHCSFACRMQAKVVNDVIRRTVKETGRKLDGHLNSDVFRHVLQCLGCRDAKISKVFCQEPGHGAMKSSEGLVAWLFSQSSPQDADTPKLGVVRLDYDYPPAPGDIDHPGSY